MSITMWLAFGERGISSNAHSPHRTRGRTNPYMGIVAPRPPGTCAPASFYWSRRPRPGSPGSGSWGTTVRSGPHS